MSAQDKLAIDVNLEGELKTLLGEFNQAANRYDPHLKVFIRPALMRFQKLTPTEQINLIKSFKVFQGILESIDVSEPINDKVLLWRALKSLGLSPSSEVMDLINEGDFIEVYMGDKQVYRSFNYYSVCSYPIDFLNSVPWELLFERDKDKTMGIFEEIYKVVTTRKILESKIGPHEIHEKCSLTMNKFRYNLRYICPLKDLENDRPDCFLGIIEAKLLSGKSITDLSEDEILNFYMDVDKKLKQF